MLLTYAAHGYGLNQTYVNTLWRAWGLVREEVTEGTTIIIRYRTTVPRITALTEKFLLGQIDECMPYSSLVNFLNAAVVIPPPC